MTFIKYFTNHMRFVIDSPIVRDVPFYNQYQHQSSAHRSNQNKNGGKAIFTYY